MLNTMFRTSLIGGWVTLLAVMVTLSITMGASLSTTSLLLVLGVAPGVVMALLRNGASSPTVAEILHAVDAKDRRP
jgi:hypothetical protein